MNVPARGSDSGGSQTSAKHDDVAVDVSDAKIAAQAAAMKGAAGQPMDSRKRYILIAAAAVLTVVALGLGLGVGLGVGLKKSSSSGSSGQAMYYIAADPVMWNYALLGNNCFNLTQMQTAWEMTNFTPPSPVGGTFKKALYRQYTDATFTTLVTRSYNESHLGLLGPLIQVEAGSTLTVLFKNNLNFAVNMEPGGGMTWSNPDTYESAVLPGATAFYTWTIPVAAAPVVQAGTGYQNSRLYLYRSSVDPTAHDNAGLVGPIIVTAQGYANPDGTTKGVDRVIITLFQIYLEQASPYVFDNAVNPALNNSIFNKMAINGHTWCNWPNATVNVGENTRWYVAAVGGVESTHNFHWHGNVFTNNGHHQDHINVVGSNTDALDLVADDPGTWILHCHVNSHLDGGMMGFYTVNGAKPNITTFGTGVNRTFYIAAEEVTWDYGPMDADMCNGSAVALTPAIQADLYLGPTDGFKVGSNWTKSLYIQYTDATFTTRVNRTADEAYLGLLGPIIRANVGDLITVVFLNRIRFPASMHPHGVVYDKAHEGAPYNDGTTGADKADDIVMPNTTYTYVWGVAERSGPGPSDTSSIVWMYHSHVGETADTTAGLIGAIIINRAGSTNGTSLLPTDIDGDAVFYFTVLDEWAGNYRYVNVYQYLDPIWWNTTDALTNLFADDDFHEACRHHLINGWMYCNNPVPQFTAGKRIRLHIMALGSQEDIHTPNIGGGGSYLRLGKHTSSVAALAGTMTTQDVVFTQPGIWSIMCRVADHVLSGMQAFYEVTPAASGPLAIKGSVTRTYYIAADIVTWNYAPNGYQQCTADNMQLISRPYLTASSSTLGSKRLKAQYRQYTDATFTTLKSRPAWYGLQGPLITAEVGDVITIVFKNNLNFTVDLSPDGGLVAYHNTTLGVAVQPGTTFTYTWVVPVQAGPLAGDLSFTMFPYLSVGNTAVDMTGNVAAGLVGMMAIAAKGVLQSDGMTPNDVDLVVPLLFQVYNENISPFNDANIALGGFSATVLSEIYSVNASTFQDTFQNYNTMSAINGYMYCNLPTLSIPVGTRVRLLLLGYGSEESMHSPRVLGQLLELVTGASQSAQLMASLSAVADLVPLTAGVWPIEDDIHDHYIQGQLASMVITAASPSSGRKMRA